MTADSDPEIVVHIGGRGRMSWSAGDPGPEDPRRPWGVVYLPPGAALHAHGKLQAICVTLPGLGIDKTVGPVKEVLVGLLCRRARYGSDTVAEVALKLVRLLMVEEAEKTPLEDEQRGAS